MDIKLKSSLRDLKWCISPDCMSLYVDREDSDPDYIKEISMYPDCLISFTANDRIHSIRFGRGFIVTEDIESLQLFITTHMLYISNLEAITLYLKNTLSEAERAYKSARDRYFIFVENFSWVNKG